MITHFRLQVALLKKKKNKPTGNMYYHFSFLNLFVPLSIDV